MSNPDERVKVDGRGRPLTAEDIDTLRDTITSANDANDVAIRVTRAVLRGGPS